MSSEDDPTTTRLLESTIAVEEEYAEDLKTLLEGGDSPPCWSSPSSRSSCTVCADAARAKRLSLDAAR
jgi:hypothetical protein